MQQPANKLIDIDIREMWQADMGYIGAYSTEKGMHITIIRIIAMLPASRCRGLVIDDIAEIGQNDHVADTVVASIVQI